MSSELMKKIEGATTEPSPTYNDEQSVKYAHEPEFKAAVSWAQKEYGLGWEVACEYAKARDAGEDAHGAAFEALYDWDLLENGKHGGLVMPGGAK